MSQKSLERQRELKEKLSKRPIIAAIREFWDIAIALEKKVAVIFVLCGDIFDLMRIKREIRDSGVLLFAHLDLIEGIGKDKAGIKFLKQEIGIDGILTTRSRLIKFAKKETLFTIQRLFILDSEGLGTGISVVRECSPWAIEILPGIILPRLKDDLARQNLPPIIAGGLNRTEKEIKEVLKSGALAISTSRKELWGFKV